MREMPMPPNRHLGIIASTTLLSRLRTFKLPTPISVTLKTVTHVPRNARATLLTPSLRLWARLHSAALTFCYPASTCFNLASLRAIARHACEAVVLIMQWWHFRSLVGSNSQQTRVQQYSYGMFRTHSCGREQYTRVGAAIEVYQ